MFKSIVEREAHDEYYKDNSYLDNVRDVTEYLMSYEMNQMSPFYQGGTTKGYVRGLATRKLFQSTQSLNSRTEQITVLDAGCGQGTLSVFLACKGYRVIGVDLSEVACAQATKLAAKLGVTESCSFIAEDLGNLSLIDESVDLIIGHAALHHFIKYESIPKEFARILKENGQGYFADSFGENRLFHVFHDKKKMKRLGDVSLTKQLVENFFQEYFDVKLIPTDWLTMLDKLFLRISAKKFELFARNLSRFFFAIDRLIPETSRVALFFSGAVVTTIKKRSQQ